MGELKKFLPPQTVGVCATYRNQDIVAAVAKVYIGDADELRLSFPKRNPFQVGDAITVHLDDRVGSELYSIELKVYRSSYKGRVTVVNGLSAVVQPEDFELFYGTRVVASGRAEGYTHPADSRPDRGLPPSPLGSASGPVVLADERTRSDNLGVLVTRAVGRPHTTVMAYLSSASDDIFLITGESTFKWHNLARDPDAVFALDHRNSWVFEREVDWNYTLYQVRAHVVDRASAVFGRVQAEFIAKNPWEEPFFASSHARLVHLAPRRIIQQDILCD